MDYNLQLFQHFIPASWPVAAVNHVTIIKWQSPLWKICCFYCTYPLTTGLQSSKLKYHHHSHIN